MMTPSKLSTTGERGGTGGGTGTRGGNNEEEERRKLTRTIPRSPVSGIGNSRFTNYLHNKSPSAINSNNNHKNSSTSSKKLLLSKFPTTTTPPDHDDIENNKNMKKTFRNSNNNNNNYNDNDHESSLYDYYPTIEQQNENGSSLGDDIYDLGNEIKDLYHFISTKNTPEGTRKPSLVYNNDDITTLVYQLIHGM